MIVTRLFRLSALSFSPSKVTRAFLRVKSTESRIIEELKMYGKRDMSRVTFKSEITANAATVMPMAKEPALPTKILPRTLKYASISQIIRGPTIRMYVGENAIKPKMTMAGHTVSSPFKPPSMLTVFVTIMTIIGTIRKT